MLNSALSSCTSTGNSLSSLNVSKNGVISPLERINIIGNCGSVFFLGTVTKPCLMLAGSADAVSGYETGIRKVFAGLTGTTRHLLTFDGAGHNAAAPIPAPDESWTLSAALDFLPAEHYADPVWDTVWMNAVAQHMIAAFVGLHLQGDTGLALYLSPDLPGFANGKTKGLRLETLK